MTLDIGLFSPTDTDDRSSVTAGIARTVTDGIYHGLLFLSRDRWKPSVAVSSLERLPMMNWGKKNNCKNRLASGNCQPRPLKNSRFSHPNLSISAAYIAQIFHNQIQSHFNITKSIYISQSQIHSHLIITQYIDMSQAQIHLNSHIPY